MTADRDTTRIVRSWLRSDEHESADRVLQTVLSRLDTTPQRRHLWPTWRFALMNTYAKFAIAAAAVLVVAVVGYNLLPGTGGFGGKPTASPPPTVAPSPTPIPSLGTGALQPGRYAEYWDGIEISFEVPAGWIGTLPFVFNQDGVSIFDPLPDTGIEWGPWPPSVLRPITVVYADACHSEGQLKSVGPTVDDLVQALSAQLNSDAVVTDVTIGGLPAKRVDIVQPPALDHATCRNGADGPIQIWADPGERYYFSLPPGTRGVVQIVDVGGVRVVLAGTIGPAASSSDLAELDRIIASTAFARP